MKGEIFSRAVGFLASFSQQPSSPSSSSSSLQTRDATECPNTSYTTENGLQFDTYCGIDFLFPGSGSTIEPDMASCMDQCSFYQPVCFGVTYYTQNQTCSFKTIGINSSYASTSDSDNVHVNSALANVTQMAGLDPTCPFQNNSIIPTDEGMPFHIYCNQDMGGIGDYTPWGVSDRPHTETMMECMELCEHAHPLCLGVAWNADLTAGYGNCYLKNAQGVPNTVGYVTHTGLVQMPIIDSCNSSGQHQITSNDKTFNISCYEGRSGSSNATSLYSANITGCVDECAKYSGTDSCLGVFYDNSFDDGFDNCYLLNDTGTNAGFGGNSTFAALVSGTPSNSSSSPSTSTSPSTSATSASGGGGGDSGGGSSSKAWIAGPVIGALAAVAIAFAGLFFWRRRRTVRGGGERGEEKKAFVPVDQRDAMGSPGVHELPRYPVSEMEASESRHELPGN